MVVTYFKKVMYNVICVTGVCIQFNSINMFLVSQLSGFIQNFNIGIFSDTINVYHYFLFLHMF